MIDFGIIAAGEGERLKEDGLRIPKPLVKIDGKPMIERLIQLFDACDASSINVIVNSDMTEVSDYLEKLMLTTRSELKYISKKTESSMHSFYELMHLMKPTGKFVITTVDTIFRNENFRKYLDYFENLPHGIDGVMGVTTYIDDEKPLYVDTEGTHRISAFKDTPEKGIKYISAGIYGLQPTSFPVLQECIDKGVLRMRNFQRELIEKGLNLDAFNMGKVMDVDHLSDVAKAEEFLKDNSFIN